MKAWAATFRARPAVADQAAIAVVMLAGGELAHGEVKLLDFNRLILF